MNLDPAVYLGSALENALFLLVGVSLPFLIVVVLGAVLSGMFRVATQIDDLSIGFLGRSLAAFAFLYFASSYYGPRVVSYATRIWGGSDFYF